MTLQLDKKIEFIKKDNLSVKIKGIYETLRIFLNNLIEIPFIFFLYKKREMLGEKKKLLLVNTGDLGDNILVFGFLNFLNSQHFASEIYLLVKSPNHKIYKFLKNGIKIISWDKNRYKKNLFYKLKFVKEIRKENFNVAFNITPERGILNEELTLVCNAENYWKINKVNKFINPLFRNFFNKKYQKNFEISSKNEYQIFKEIIGKMVNGSAIKNDKNKDKTKISEDNIIVIAPFSSDSNRTWGLKNYLALAEELSKNSSVYFIGTKGNFDSVEDLNIKNSNIKNYCGKIDLEDIPNLIYKARLFVGNDSGLTHLALYLNVPLIAIIGGGMYGRFFPYNESELIRFFSYEMECFGCEWNCIYKERYCLTKVKLEDIVNASFKILESNVN